MKLGIIGIQGSGKGTQAKLIAKEFKLKRVSIGKILRDEIASKSRRGKILKKYVDKGLLAPNRIVNELILKNLPRDNFIVDGFPRDKKQLNLAKRVGFDKIILLTLLKKEVYKRIRKRRKLEGREDDAQKALDERLKIFYEQSPKIIKFFGKKISRINGNQSVKKVFGDVKKRLK